MDTRPPSQSEHAPLLTASGLEVLYEPAGGPPVHAVRGVDISIGQGQLVGLVGESGCGKSTLGYALARLLRPPARIAAGTVVFDSTDITNLDRKSLRGIRHNGLAVVLQSGMNALNPVRRVRGHFHDVLGAQQRLHAAEVDNTAETLLSQVELAPSVLDRYPHELSGGMRQRVAIALALALKPRLVVFDEPTTALDVIVQRAIMDTIARLQAEVGFTALIISHDLGLVLGATDQVWVMYAGRIVERRDSPALATGPLHPYSAALLACQGDPTAEKVELGGIPGSPPDLSKPPEGCAFAPRCWLSGPPCKEEPHEKLVGTGSVTCHMAPTKLEVPKLIRRVDGPSEPIPDSGHGAKVPTTASAAVAKGRGRHRDATTAEPLALIDVTKDFKTKRAAPSEGVQAQGLVQAVAGVSLRLEAGQAMGLVGGSGSGKTTLGRMIVGLERPSSGSITLGNLRVDKLRTRDLPRYWRRVQMVFQDPYAGLNPLHSVGYTVGRAIRNHQGLKGDDYRRELLRLFDTVGLAPPEHYAAKLPHQLSGGQRQRVVIARALAAKPQVLVADEPVSMLDVSLRAEILHLLGELRKNTGASLLYITHDLLSARLVTDQLVVLRQGHIVESGPTSSVLRSPSHPYTVELIAAIPTVQQSQTVPAGAITERPGEPV